MQPTELQVQRFLRTVNLIFQKEKEGGYSIYRLVDGKVNFAERMAKIDTIEAVDMFASGYKWALMHLTEGTISIDDLPCAEELYEGAEARV